jgi:predicted O-methyltransferase YrrM
MNIIPSELNDYCDEFSQGDSKILQELTAYTIANEDVPQMISGPQVGNVLQSFIRLLHAKNIIEVGMFTGYSALKMAEALPEKGRVHTCELMEKHVRTAGSFFDKSDDGHKIIIHQGPASDSLEQLGANQFDLAFIDADKTGYLDYYKKCMVLVRPGGVIILDNMLWGGAVLDPQDEDTKALRETAEYIQNDELVTNYLLSVRDGLMVCLLN